MKNLSLYIDKWYIVATVNTNSGPHPLSLPNKEQRIWLYFYNNVTANRVEYGYRFKENALAGELNYYTDIFQLILGSEGKTYKCFGIDIEMRNIFQNAGIFGDLREGFGDEVVETYVSFSSDITLEGQSIFLDLLRNNKFDVKGFVAQLDYLALEYAYKMGTVKDCLHVIVANACNENLHYALYKHEGEVFMLLESKILNGLGEDLRSRALVEHVIDTINTLAHIISTKEERQEEHLYLSRFVNEWIELLDNSNKNIPTPLGWVNLKKQIGNKYPIIVQKSDIDNQTSVIIGGIVTEIIKLVTKNDIQCHQISHVVFIGDTFDNGQFKKVLSQYLPIPDNRFIHFHEKELGDIVNVYHELPREWFDNDEARFATLSKNQREKALEAKKQREELEEARKRDEEEFLRRQRETEQSRNLQTALTLAKDAENKNQYEDALGFYKTASAIDSSNSYISQKIDELNEVIADQKSKKKLYDEYIHKAREAYDSKDWDNAVAQSTLALGVMTDSSDAKELLNAAKDMATKYARLKECLSKIDFLIEKGAYAEAQREIENTGLLNIKDSAIEERRNKIAIAIQQLQYSISVLKEKLDSATSQENYDLAINICAELSNLDTNNKQQWESQKEVYIIQQEQKLVTINKLRQLRKQIDEKHLAQNWVNLLSLCKAYLVIESDEYIQELMTKAEEQIKLESLQQQFDKSYENHDWQTILSLSKSYSILKNNPANNRVIKEAMVQNRKKTDYTQFETNGLMKDMEEKKDSTRSTHSKASKMRQLSSPITLLPEDDVRIDINTSPKKPFKRLIRKTNDLNKAFAGEKNVQMDNGVSNATSEATKKRKFPKVKRNNIQ